MTNDTQGPRATLIEAAGEARVASFNGANQFMDALADWWRAESEAHFHIGDDDDTTNGGPKPRVRPFVVAISSRRRRGGDTHRRQPMRAAA